MPTRTFLSLPDSDDLVKVGDDSNVVVSARARYSSTGMPILWETTGRSEREEDMLTSGQRRPASVPVINLNYFVLRGILSVSLDYASTSKLGFVHYVYGKWPHLAQC